MFVWARRVARETGRTRRGRKDGTEERKRERERREAEEGESEMERKGKKNQANWYAAHNNRRVERRGSEVRPALGGSLAPGERVEDQYSLFFSRLRRGTYTPAERMGA